jgi:hypothetical protein
MAVLAPAATIIAIAMLAFAGGFAHLGALGQAFNGPTLPSSIAHAGVGPGPTAHGTRQVSGLGATLLLASATGAGGGGGTGHGGASRSPGTNGSTGPGGGGPGGFTGGPQPVPGGKGGNPPPPPSNPPPKPPPHQTLVDGVVKIGTSVTSKLPGPVGTAATQALQSVGQTVDGILPPQPSARAPVVSGKLLGGVHLP